jgi:hypothetical protein
MRFVDFLKTTVLVCAAGATALAALSVLRAADRDDEFLMVFSLAWWTVAALAGGWLGRRPATLPAIARLLAEARSTTTLPDQRPVGRVLVNRLWPLLVVLVACAGLAWPFPEVSAIGAGFMAIWALYWRRQEGAVTAVEERDGVAFFIERASPFRAMKLVRTPGFRRAPGAEPL